MTEFKKTGFGATLRQRREELTLSLDDLAASTRIRKTYLQALEEENLPALPGAAYVIGFLRIYARQLGLPVEPLLSSLAGNAENEDRVDLTSTGGELTRSPNKNRKRGKGGRLLILIGLLLFLIGVAAYVYLSPGTSAPPPAPVTAVNTPESAPAVDTMLPPAQVAPPMAVPAPVQAQEEVVVAELPVIPAGGAVVRMLPVAAGVMKVSLDNQELREYQLQPEQSLNWKVTGSLACELSTPGLVRVWVGQEEIPVSEYPAFILKGNTQ